MTDYDMKYRLEALLAKRHRYPLSDTRVIEVHIEDDRGFQRDYIVFEVDVNTGRPSQRIERIPS